MKLKVTVDGVRYDVEVEVEEDAPAPLGAIFMGGGFVPQHAATPAASATPTDGQGVTAPLAGTVVRVPVKEGQEIAEGDVLVVLEAMKMEQPIQAPRDGIVASITGAAGETVSSGTKLLELADAE